jgi:hypothetical protein
VFIRVHLWLIGFFFLRGRASRELRAGLIQRRAQSLPSSIILHLSSVLRVLCAFVANAFSSFDRRPTTNDDRAWICASVVRLPSAVLPLTPDT